MRTSPLTNLASTPRPALLPNPGSLRQPTLALPLPFILVLDPGFAIVENVLGF